MSPEYLDQCALEQSILRTVLYSDLFDYALTPDEVVHYLIGPAYSADRVRTCLSGSRWLNEQISCVDGYVTARGREALAQRRLDRAGSSERLWRSARRFVRILSSWPFVRMIAVTGALAMHNSAGGDDIDVLIVTAADRVWLTRALTVLLVRVGKLCGDTLCPNYVLSENALALDEHTMFVAHEFAQMVPVYGLAVYQRMRSLNPWIAAILPNATQPYGEVVEHEPGRVSQLLKRIGERLLSGRWGDWLERWEMNRKLRKFQPRLRQANSNAVLDRDRVKGHFDDYSQPITQRYRHRLQEFNLIDPVRQFLS